MTTYQERINGAVRSATARLGLTLNPFNFRPIWERTRAFHTTNARYYYGNPFIEDVGALDVLYEPFLQAIGVQFEELAIHGVLTYASDDDPFDSCEALFSLVDLPDTDSHIVIPVRATVTRDRNDYEGAEASPMFALSPYFGADNKPLRWNDVFRFVHNTFTHTVHRVDFTTDGETNAWLAHAVTLPRDAWAALHRETILQTSFYEVHQSFPDQRPRVLSAWNEERLTRLCRLASYDAEAYAHIHQY